ncbi:nucleotidyltransferase family protein [Ancylobacter sp. SL191]|uniref:nucleotidyltransferase family protein n=1 Tax=Ancylobacter sp. SL191 TaxID=2995166 RepID=UPI00226DD34A|nr:nucleotidyltransferase domain-containing protein [Ancylobacter sp. SL191]WAC28843.1 nucleotidyltransferase domain-containing protein [Ancylobacter sp. SL191]
MDLSRDQLIRSLLALQPRLRAEGVTRLALFGSRAREDHRRDSDIDVAIDVEPDRKFSLIDLVGVAQEIESETGLSANIFMRRSLDEGFRRTLERDAIEIF